MTYLICPPASTLTTNVILLQIFTDAGKKITFASIKGGQPPVDEGSVEAFKADDVCNEFLASSETQDALKQSSKLEDVTFADFGAVFFAGGHGTMWDFPGSVSPSVNSAIEGVYGAGGVVASVCHGPACLVDAKVGGEYLIKGKQFTCFTNSEETAMSLEGVVPFMLESKLVELGGVFKGGEDWASVAVVDGRLVTGQNPASATAAAEKVVELLA